MKPGCSLIAYLHGKPEKRNELLAVLSAFVAPTRAEPGCVEYHLHISQDVLTCSFSTRIGEAGRIWTRTLSSRCSRRFLPAAWIC